jgi:hypothetical protein
MLDMMENMMDIVTLQQPEMVRTTITLPADLIARSQPFLDRGMIASRNALVVAAVEHFLAELERQEIDRQFAAMGSDEGYQALNEVVADDFADSDWEALKLGESESV